MNYTIEELDAMIAEVDRKIEENLTYIGERMSHGGFGTYDKSFLSVYQGE